MDIAGNDIGDEDGTLDCTPVIFERCTEMRASVEGKCESEADVLEARNCGTAGGTCSKDLGVCECANTKPESTTCGDQCLADRLKTYHCQTNGNSSTYFYKIVDGSGTTVRTISSADAIASLDPSSGTDTCTETECCKELTFIASGSSYSAPQSESLENILTRLTGTSRRGGEIARRLLAEDDGVYDFTESDELSNASGTFTTGRRLLQVLATTSSVNTPLICLAIDESVSFDVSASSNSYPVYSRMSTINTNPSFDYGSFETNAQTVMNSGASLFTYQFTESGTYEFYTNGNTAAILVIRVQESGVACPGPTVQAYTINNLLALQVSTAKDIVLAPDWILLASIVGSLFLGLLGLVLGMWWLQRRGWGVARYKEPHYRVKGLDQDMDDLALKGTHDFTKEKTSGKGGSAEDRLNLEAFSVNTLYDKLEDQTIQVNGYMQAHERGFQQHYEKLGKATNSLKSLIVAMMEKILNEEDRAELQGMMDGVKDSVEGDSMSSGMVDQGAMMEMFEQFAAKSNNTGDLLSSLDPETAHLLAGVLGMAGGLSVQDGVLVAQPLQLESSENPSSEQPGLSNQELDRLTDEHSSEKAAFAEIVSTQDEEVLTFISEQRERANQMLLEDRDEEARRILKECDKYRQDAAKKLENEADRQRKLLAERASSRRKAKAATLKSQQATELEGKKNASLIEHGTEEEASEAVINIDAFVGNVEECSGATMQQLRVNLADYGNSTDAVERALREYKSASDMLLVKAREEAEAKTKALRAQLAARKNKDKATLDSKHTTELEQIENDPDIVAQVQLRQAKESEMLEHEHRAADDVVDTQVQGMEQMIKSLERSANSMTKESNFVNGRTEVAQLVDATQLQLQDDLNTTRKRLQSQIVWKLDALMKGRKETKVRLQLELMQNLESLQDAKIKMTRESEALLDEINHKNQKIVEKFVQGHETKAEAFMQQLEQRVAKGEDSMRVLNEFDMYNQDFKAKSATEEQSCMNTLIRSMKDDNEARVQAVKARSSRAHGNDPLQEARELHELDEVMAIADRALSDHESVLHAALQDLYIRLSSMYQTLLVKIGAGNPGKSVQEILNETEAARLRLNAGSAQQFADRQEALERQLAKRKARRQTHLKAKHQMQAAHVADSNTELTLAELQAKHAREQQISSEQLAASCAGEQATLDQINSAMQAQLRKVDEVVNQEAEDITATFEEAKKMDSEERRLLVQKSRDEMSAMSRDFEDQKLQQQQAHEAQLELEISTRQTRLEAKAIKMDQQWKNREAELAIPELQAKIKKMSLEKEEAMKEFESRLESKAQEQYINFVSKLEASQVDALRSCTAEVDAELARINDLNSSPSAGTTQQMRQEAKNRYDQVHAALNNEKARQLAVFHAKQDERKKQRLQFKFGHMEQLQSSLQALLDALESGQVKQEQHQAATAKLTDDCMLDESEKIREIDSQWKSTKQEILMRYKGKIELAKSVVGSPGGQSAMDGALADIAEQQESDLAEASAIKADMMKKIAHQMALRKLSQLEDLIDTQEDEVAVQITTEESLIAGLRQLEENAEQNQSDAIEMDMSTTVPPELTQKLAAIKAEHEAKANALKAEMEEELAKYSREEELREQAALKQAQEELEREHMQQSALQEAEMLARRQRASDDEAKRIIAEYEQKSSQQTAMLNAERKAQQEKMQARMRAKKAQKAAELAEKMNKQTTEMLKLKQQSMRAEREDALWEAELQKVNDVLNHEDDYDVNRVKLLVQTVLESRQDREMLDLAADMLAARVARINSATGPLNSKWEAQLRTCRGTPKEAVMERAYQQELDVVIAQAREQHDREEELAELQLKKEHVEQVLRMTATVAPQFAEQIRDSMSAALEISISDGDSGVTEKMQKLLEMQADLGSRKQEEIDAALANLDKELQDETRREQQKFADQVQKLQSQKQHAIKKKVDEQDLLELQASSENERNALAMQHRADLLSFTRLLDDEEARQVAKLEEKAAQREEQRQQKRRMFENQVNMQFQQNEETLRQQYEQAQQEQLAHVKAMSNQLDQINVGYEAHTAKQSAEDELAIKLAGQVKGKEEELSIAEPIRLSAPPAQTLGDATQLVAELNASFTEPLLSRIENIEALIKSGNSGQGSVQSYVDPLDSRWKQKRGTQIVEISSEQLSSTQMNSFKVAQQAVRALPTGMHRIRSLAAASDLPVTSSSSSAFSESYHFEAGTGKLHLRAERLNSVGEMLTVLAHANAHIQCGSMESDQDPRFQREFYSTLQTLLGSKFSAPMPDILPVSNSSSDVYSTRNAEMTASKDILGDFHEANRKMQEQEGHAQQQQKEALARKMTQRSAKREAQVRSVMKSKFSGGSTKLTKHQARAQKQQVKKLFDSMDVDGGGTLDAQEVQGLLSLLGVKLNSQEQEEVMAQYGGGEVSFEAFFEWYST